MIQNIIEIRDKYGDQCLIDGRKNNIERNKPLGFVEVYELDESGEKELVGKSNLVIYQGRELIASRMFNTQNPNVSFSPDYFITWFGIGDGGCDPGDPLTPIPPINTDTNLYNEIPISSSDSTSCGDFHDGYYWKKSFDSVEFEEDPYNDNSWLIVKLTITLDSIHAIGENINEIGLYASPTGLGPYLLYSRATFATIPKSSTSSLIFVWYLYY